MKFEFLESIECVRLVNTETGEVITVPQSEYEERYYVCSDCGEVFDKEDEGIEVEGEWVCDDCLENSGDYVQCEECSDWIKIENATPIYGDTRYVCEDCCIDKYGVCDDCGEYFPIDDLIEIDGNFYCEDCVDSHAFYCEGHQEWESSRNNEWVEVCGETYCYDYACDNFYRCENCGEWFYDSDDGYWDDWNDEWYCEYCYNNGYGHHNEFILDYHEHDASEKSQFLDNEDRTKFVHMGYELEVDNGGSPEDEDAEEVANIIGHDYFVFETDGSVDGFEMISQPGSLNAHLSRYDKIKEYCKYLVGSGYTSHNCGRCGLHVHIDRKYFGDVDNDSIQDLANAKFLWIFAKWWDELVRFSRRNSFTYCTKTRQTTWNDDTVIPFAKLAKGYEHSRWNPLSKQYKYSVCHGNCVNIGGENTIEIRLWRGSLRPETIKATLKFTARLAELVKTKTVNELNNMTFEDILGNDEDILAYWETRKDRPVPSEARSA